VDAAVRASETYPRSSEVRLELPSLGQRALCDEFHFFGTRFFGTRWGSSPDIHLDCFRDGPFGFRSELTPDPLKGFRSQRPLLHIVLQATSKSLSTESELDPPHTLL
jgi:hypothetical protein